MNWRESKDRTYSLQNFVLLLQTVHEIWLRKVDILLPGKKTTDRDRQFLLHSAEGRKRRKQRLRGGPGDAPGALQDTAAVASTSCPIPPPPGQPLLPHPSPTTSFASPSTQQPSQQEKGPETWPLRRSCRGQHRIRPRLGDRLQRRVWCQHHHPPHRVSQMTGLIAFYISLITPPNQPTD